MTVTTLTVPTSPLTDPWAADTGTILRAQHGQRVSAQLVTRTGVLITTLQIVGGTVAWDETRAPRVAASLDVRTLDSQAAYDQADPRAAVRLQVSAGYVRPGGVTDIHPLADLSLRARTLNRPDNTLRMTAASDESIVVDNSPISDTVMSGTAQSLIQSLVAAAMGSTPAWVVDVDASAAVTLDAVTDRFASLNDVADQIGARVYDDGLRTWHIGPSVVAGTTAAAVLLVGAGGVLVSTEATMQRSGDYFNRVVLDYRWRTAAGVESKIIGVSAQASGPYAAGVENTVTYYERRTTSSTQATANAAAAAILARTVQRGRTFTLTAPSHYWLRPGHTVTVQLPLGPQERHIVQAVEFDLPTARMTLTTRRPDA